MAQRYETIDHTADMGSSVRGRYPYAMAGAIKAAALFFFFASGVCGLIYEVVWVRMFGLVLGNTTYAISMTLGAFFAGMALGGLFAGRYVDRLKVGERRRLIRLYAYLEFGIGASAVFVGSGISLLQTVFIWTNQNVSDASTIIHPVRFVFSFVLLLVPTALMGATLPILSKFIITPYEGVRKGLGLLYGINTFGAALGCLAAGFVLIRTFGVDRTVLIAVVINITIGAVVLILDRLGFFCCINNEPSFGEKRREASDRPIAAIAKSGAYVSDSQHSTKIVVIAMFGLSGFASIAYELVWARLLSSIFLNSVYSFATMLATFLCGLAIGSVIVARFVKWQKSPLTLLAVVEFGIGICGLILVALFNRLPDISARISAIVQTTGAPSWGMNICIEFVLSFMVMIVPCALMGMTLPLAGQIAARDVTLLGRCIGNVYASTTIGGIAGALITGCFLIPISGVKLSEIFIAGLNIVIGMVFLVIARRHTWGSFNLYVKAVVIPLLAVFAIGIGVFYAVTDIRMWSGDGELLYYKEDPAATVSVTKGEDGDKRLTVNRKYTLGTSKAAPLQKRMGYIPLLLHGNPEDVLVIGMGTGITLGAVTSYSQTKTVKCVEVISSVVEAAATYFVEENNNACNDSKTEIINEDGRNYLLLNKDKYDLIISDLFVPYHAGAGALYSEEHFRLCRDRLSKGGVFCQWLPLYQMSTKEFRVICRTVAAVFPHATLWFCNFEKGLICGVVGSGHKLAISPHSLSQTMDDVDNAHQLKRAFLGTPDELLSLFITDKAGIESFTDGCAINTDNDPVIEFMAPKNLYAFWNAAGKRDTKDRHIGIHNLTAAAGIRDAPLSMVKTGLDVRPGGGRFDPEVLGYYADAVGHLIAGTLYFYQDRLAMAEDEYLTAWELAPDHLYLRKMFTDLSVRFYRAGNYDETIFINEKLINAREEIVAPFLYFYLGLAYQARGQTDMAISAYRNALALDPPNRASIHYNIGIIYSGMGLVDEAASEFAKAENYREK